MIQDYNVYFLTIKIKNIETAVIYQADEGNKQLNKLARRKEQQTVRKRLRKGEEDCKKQI